MSQLRKLFRLVSQLLKDKTATEAGTFLAVVLAALAIACEGKNTQPVAPSALQSGSGSASSGAPLQVGTASAAAHAVTLFDACDPATFNAVLGPGACTRSGGITFQSFVEQLTRHHSIGS
jgi:hypothetical protein